MYFFVIWLGMDYLDDITTKSQTIIQKRLGLSFWLMPPTNCLKYSTHLF